MIHPEYISLNEKHKIEKEKQKLFDVIHSFWSSSELSWYDITEYCNYQLGDDILKSYPKK